ncbi:MAG: ABC transporter permease [Proteobacteria bacterium]|nr:ABC transporter permease [Pseudomonadota bacterium]
MFGYYVDLALRSFRRHRMLTALMVLAIALGIGAAMTTLTVFHVLSGDPIPEKSSRLFYVQMEPRNKDGYTPGEEPETQLTRYDAQALLREHRGDQQALMSAGGVAVEPTRAGLTPFNAESRYTSADFFPMFDVPFRYGQPWGAADDDARARVVVISKALDDKLFDGGNSVGKTLRLDGKDYRIVGVLADWQPTPRFYDLTSTRYGQGEQVFLPFSTSRDLKLGTDGNMECWSANNDPDGSTGLNAPCAWVQYWVQLDSAAKVAAYKQYLVNYSDAQRKAGRFQRPTNTRLSDVMAWLDHNKVVPSDVKLQLWLAFGFLGVCLLNTVGLLLAKFLRRSAEIGVRRALGASKRAIFAQYMVEAGAIGLAGGVLGLALAELGLWAVRQQPADYAALANLDPLMLLTTFALALAASLLAGILPAWRAMQIVPAMQLKSQ